jgi:transcriptional regulator with XRE-family HTH domain
MEADTMPAADLAEALRNGRFKSGLSVRQLEAQSGVTKSTISRLEHGEVEAASPLSLVRLAQALELRSTDLFLLAGLAVPDDLPTLPAMLRAEYDLPPEAIAEIQANIERVARRYQRPDARNSNSIPLTKGGTHE